MDAPVILETYSNPFDMESMCGENGRCGKPADFSDHSFFGNNFPLGSHSWRSGSPGREFTTTTNIETPQNHTNETTQNESTTSQNQSRQQNPEMANNVRIIPIHVEGYDEPVMPSNENLSARPAPKNVHHPSHDEKQDKTEKQHQTTQQSQPRSTPPPQTQSKSTPPPSETQHPTPPPQKLGPIEQIKSIQSSVLELMGEVERFNGKPKDKQYSYLDEMLTRNLLKLDNVETEGKDTIRQARKEAVKCIQQCLGILEAKAKANKELQDQLLEIDRLVGNITKPVESVEQKESVSMEVDTEANLEKKSDDVETETEKNESIKESTIGEREGMDMTSEVSNNLETDVLKDDNQNAENKEASKI